MEFYQYILLIGVGLASGFINVLAGGGSLLTLPVMIFLGLPPSVANGTNRVALLAQNTIAVSNFNKKNVSPGKFGIILGLFALVGSILGASIAVDIPEDIFNKMLSVVMIIVAILMAIKPSSVGEEGKEQTLKIKIISYISFFFVGVYGGFLHAGVGFLMMLALVKVNGFSLVKTNSIKVTVALIYTVSALIVFIIDDKIDWTAGLILAIGSATGGWLGSNFAVKKGDKWIKRFVVVAIIAMAIKLWVF